MAFPARVHAASILAVRTWPADEYTRVTLEMDSALKVDSFTLKAPNRLVVDVHGISMSQAINSLVSQITFDDPYVQRVRVAQNSPGVVRLVMELKQQVAPQIFTLKPVAGYAHRLVIDLFPLVAQDPLAAILKEMPGRDDPLATLLAQIGRAGPPDVPAPIGIGQKPPAALPSLPATPSPRGVGRTILIAIDAGHGGEDPGAIGPKGTREKDVVLAIAKKLKSLIDGQSRMKAYLTRDADYFVPLQVRVQKARRVKADLFISIHADAWIKPSARGGSVFVLSEKGASSAMARTLARQQNASDLIGGLNVKAPNKQVAQVLLDLTTAAQIEDSKRLGSHILGHMGKMGALHKRHVEGAGFAVLKAPDIPSVLVETAFISNPEEEQLLRSGSYQDKLAQAINSGIKNYFDQGAALAIR